MDLFPNRRRFLGLAGTGAAVSVAGCNQLDTSDPDGSDAEGASSGSTDDCDDRDGTPGPTATVTAYVQPSEEDVMELQQRQLELSRQRTELDESEYQAELEHLQEEHLELIGAAIEEFESSIEGRETLELADSAAEMGLVLLEGTAGSLIEVLDDGHVAGLLPESTFAATQPHVLP